MRFPHSLEALSTLLKDAFMGFSLDLEYVLTIRLIIGDETSLPRIIALVKIFLSINSLVVFGEF